MNKKRTKTLKKEEKLLLKTGKSLTYAGTVTVYGVRVERYADDYGQCLVYAFKDKNGKTITESCGAFETDDIAQIKQSVKNFYFEPQIQFNRMWVICLNHLAHIKDGKAYRRAKEELLEYESKLIKLIDEAWEKEING